MEWIPVKKTIIINITVLVSHTIIWFEYFMPMSKYEGYKKAP